MTLIALTPFSFEVSSTFIVNDWDFIFEAAFTATL
jgi:hypothetical protein